MKLVWTHFELVSNIKIIIILYGIPSRKPKTIQQKEKPSTNGEFMDKETNLK